MYGYDDEKALGEYLAVFSTAGNIPTSQSRYGTRPQVYRNTLASVGQGLAAIIPQPLTVGDAKYVAVQTTALQRFLQAFGAPQTGQMTLPKSGSAFPAADGTQKAYVAWQQFSKETAPIRVAIAEDTGSLAERKADRLQRMTSLVMVHPNVAQKIATTAAAPKAAPKAATPVKKAATPARKASPTPTPAPAASVTVNVAEMQKIMTTLGVDPKNIADGKYGPTTKAKWAALAKSKGLDGASSGKTGGTSASVNRKAWDQLKVAAIEATPAAAADMIAATAEIQALLSALGFTAPGAALTDGRYGPTTASTWGQAAAKRKLDPFMAKKTADGKQVIVRKNTYLRIKADADAKMSPRAPMSLTQMDAKLIVEATPQELELLLSKLAPGTGTVPQRYEKAAAARKLDGRIEPSGANWVVLRATLDKLVAEFQKGAPPAPPPGPQKTALDADVEQILKGSTASVPVATVRVATAAAIQAKQYAGAAVADSGPWDPSLRNPTLFLLGLGQTTGAKRLAWETALVPGKLVSTDGKTLKAPPTQAERIKKIAASFKTEAKAAQDILKGFTEVNPAEVIARINNLGVSQTKFDRAGGAKELSQAISVFIAESGGKTPTGVYVRTSQDKVYVKNDVMLALALAVKEADQRAAATQKFRDGMVASALNAATGPVPVLALQKAFKDAVLIQKTNSGAVSKTALDLYKKVALSGAFDKATRDAFTEMARTVTIGPLVQEFQKLLGAQKRFTTEQINKQVTEVRNQVWNTYLDKAVQKKDGKLAVAMLPALATAALQGAQRYDQNITKESQQQEQAAAQKRVLDDAVKKSTAILSMLAVQQGLLQMAGPEREKINPTGVKLTGFSGKPTRDGLLQLAAMIFPEGLLETMWVAYLKKVAKKVVSGGAVTATWTGANYISLPPALANLLAQNAGEWIAKHGQSSVRVVEFKNPSVITVVVPKRQEVLTFDDKDATAQIQEKVKEKAKEVVSAKAPAADADADRLARERAEAERQQAARQQAAEQEAVAQSAQPPLPPAAPEPQKAGMGLGGVALGLGALALLLLARGDKEREQE
jgi:hypothetical protein